MVEVDEVGLGILAALLWAVSGIMAYLSTVKTGIVCISGSLSHSSLVPSLAPSSLSSLSSPVGWCMASGQIHWYRGVVHGWWCGGRVVLLSTSSSLSSQRPSPIVLWEGMSLVATVDSLICCPSSLSPDVLLT